MADDQGDAALPAATSLTQVEAASEEFSALFGAEFATCFPAGPPTSMKDFEKLYHLLGKERRPSALCLSGGGIRSATFSLGVVQALAERKWLDRFDYLSTVSGGGFIGSFLSRWRAGVPGWTQDNLVETEDNFAFDRESMPAVRRLRSFSNYLTPRWGVTRDGLTLISEAIGKFCFNFLPWALFLAALAALLRVLAIGLAEGARWAKDVVVAFGFGDALPTGLPGFFGSATAAIALAAAISVLLMLAQLLVTLVFGRFSERLQFQAAVLGGLNIGAFALLAVGMALFVLLPDALHAWLSNAGGGWTFALVTAGTGLITSLSGLASRMGPGLMEQARRIEQLIKIQYLQVISAVAVGLLCVSAGLLVRNIPRFTPGFAGKPDGKAQWWLASMHDTGPEVALAVHLPVGLVLLAAALVFAVVAGPNRSSLHSIYARRLTQAYLGSAHDANQPEQTYGAGADVPLASLPNGRFDLRGNLATPPAGKPALFHVINMTLNVSDQNDWQERRGASFTATPLHVGSAALDPGFARSENVATFNPVRGFTLGRAMAVSGAAASPNMGYYSRALTTLAMTIFNVRLGWWMRNPAQMAAGETLKEEPRLGFLMSWREALSRLSEDAGWVYLSDGGHFDNLGLYEMVRRRCAQILVVDAGCDGSYAFDDLHRVIRKIQVDFGIPIDLPGSLPGQPGAGATQRFVVGTIRYSASDPAQPDGRLIILKPMLAGDEPPSLENYRKNSRAGGNAFPHHSTADQFFDETQFESYRILGWVSGDELARALPATSFASGAKLPNRFYPALDANEQPAVSRRTSPIPSSLKQPAAAPPSTTGEGGAASVRAGGFLGEALAQARRLSTGELVMRSLGAVALVAATGGIAAATAQQLVDRLAPRDLGASQPRPDPGSNEAASEPGNGVDEGVADEEEVARVPDVTESPGPDEHILDVTNGNGDHVDLAGVPGRLASIEAKVDELLGRPAVRTDGSRERGPDPDIAASLAALAGEVNALGAKIPPDSSPAILHQLGLLQAKVDQASARLDPRRNVRGQ